MTAQAYKPPNPAPIRPGLLVPETVSVFLAGTIDMGVAEDWQAKLTEELDQRFEVDLDIYNPRRYGLDWVDMKQSVTNPEFRGQVLWELDHLARANVIAMWFTETGKSPITLMELGLFARTNKIVIGCPPGFWRRGNIEVIAERFCMPLTDNWDDFVVLVKNKLRETAATTAEINGSAICF